MTPASQLSASPVFERLAVLLREGSASQRAIADVLMRYPVKAASCSIEELARLAGASAATVSRFAREMGFAGYAELRGAVAETAQRVMDPVSKLRQRLGSDPAAEGGSGSYEASRAQLMLVDAPALDVQARRIAAKLNAARAIHVMGFGLSAHVAAILTLGLQPFHPAVSSVVEYGGTEVAAGRLMGVGSEDALIAVTVPRYAHDVVQLTRFARDQGAFVIAITDTAASPLTPLADEVMFAPAAHPVLTSSILGAVAAAEALVAAVMLSDSANAERAERLTRAIAGYLHRG
jgi:DNA-binding MurR/RpiR family transcriptional regulator